MISQMICEKNVKNRKPNSLFILSSRTFHGTSINKKITRTRSKSYLTIYSGLTTHRSFAVTTTAMIAYKFINESVHKSISRIAIPCSPHHNLF